MIREAVPMLVVLAALLLVGCATPAPQIVREPIEVRVPVAVPCNAAVPPATPAVADTGQSRPQWAKEALREREQLRAEAAELRASLLACKGTPGS